MAITIAANLSKKLPIPGANFSSQSASITITAEVSDLNQVAAEAQKLYRIAEQAVDAQLAASSVEQPAPVPMSRPAPSPQPRQASQPYRNNGQRRAPAPVTDSQLRFLKRLIDQTKAPLAGIFEQYQIGDLTQLSCRDAVGLIDELKGQVTA